MLVYASLVSGTYTYVSEQRVQSQWYRSGFIWIRISLGNDKDLVEANTVYWAQILFFFYNKFAALLLILSYDVSFFFSKIGISGLQSSKSTDPLEKEGENEVTNPKEVEGEDFFYSAFSKVFLTNCQGGVITE